METLQKAFVNGLSDTECAPAIAVAVSLVDSHFSTVLDFASLVSVYIQEKMTTSAADISLPPPVEVMGGVKRRRYVDDDTFANMKVVYDLRNTETRRNMQFLSSCHQLYGAIMSKALNTSDLSVQETIGRWVIDTINSVSSKSRSSSHQPRSLARAVVMATSQPVLGMLYDMLGDLSSVCLDSLLSHALQVLASSNEPLCVYVLINSDVRKGLMSLMKATTTPSYACQGIVVSSLLQTSSSNDVRDWITQLTITPDLHAYLCAIMKASAATTVMVFRIILDIDDSDDIISLLGAHSKEIQFAITSAMGVDDATFFLACWKLLDGPLQNTSGFHDDVGTNAQMGCISILQLFAERDGSCLRHHFKDVVALFLPLAHVTTWDKHHSLLIQVIELLGLQVDCEELCMHFVDMMMQPNSSSLYLLALRHLLQTWICTHLSLFSMCLTTALEHVACVAKDGVSPLLTCLNALIADDYLLLAAGREGFDKLWVDLALASFTDSVTVPLLQFLLRTFPVGLCGPSTVHKMVLTLLSVLHRFMQQRLHATPPLDLDVSIGIIVRLFEKVVFDQNGAAVVVDHLLQLLSDPSLNYVVKMESVGNLPPIAQKTSLTLDSLLSWHTSSLSNGCLFHSGMIGSGVQPMVESTWLQGEEYLSAITSNSTTFQQILMRCLDLDDGIEAMIFQVELLVGKDTLAPTATQYLDLITKDCSGVIRLPNPHTRDLVTQRVFESFPFLHPLLLLCAKAKPPSMYRLKDLVISLLIVYGLQWSTLTNVAAKATLAPLLVHNTSLLLAVIRYSEWLPPPLCYLDELVPFVEHVSILSALSLSCRFILENPPALNQYQMTEIGGVQSFKRRWMLSEQLMMPYDEVFQSILQSNIAQIGALYPKLHS